MQRGKELQKKANKVALGDRIDKKSLILEIPVPIIMTASGLVVQKSTVDFAGLLDGGRFIAFDAKQTSIKTRLDLKNLQPHQIEYLNAVEALGGIAFFLV